MKSRKKAGVYVYLKIKLTKEYETRESGFPWKNFVKQKQEWNLVR